MRTYDERMKVALFNVPRLAKWAQELIRDLQRRTERAEAQLAEIKQGPANSNVWRSWGLREDDQAIGHDARLRFNLGDPYENIDVRIDRRGGTTTLYIAGDRSIVVEPASGNAIHIRLTER